MINLTDHSEYEPHTSTWQQFYVNCPSCPIPTHLTGPGARRGLDLGTYCPSSFRKSYEYGENGVEAIQAGRESCVIPRSIDSIHQLGIEPL